MSDSPGFFGWGNVPPEDNSTSALVEQLTDQVAEVTLASTQAMAAASAASAAASNATISETNVANLAQQATTTLTAANLAVTNANAAVALANSSAASSASSATASQASAASSASAAAASASSASTSQSAAAASAATAATAADPGVKPDASALTGSEYVAVNQGGSVLRASLTKIAQLVVQTYQGFTQNGTGAVARAVLGKLFDTPVTPQDFGAKGDGVTDDTAACTAAVARAYAVGRKLHWPGATYLTTASIPNLHNVQHTGGGVISRNGYLFPVSQTNTTTNQIYVDGTLGNDANDGLTPAQATKTIQQAVNLVTAYRPLNGMWTVWVAAGTYNESITVPGWLNPNSNWFSIRGPQQATVQTQPVVTINNPGSSVYGISANQGNCIRVRDIMFTGWMQGAGVFFDHHCYAWTTNVWVLQCLQGIATAGSETLIEGGVLSGINWTSGSSMPTGGGAVGVYNYAAGVVTIGYNSTSQANGTVLQNFSQAAYEGKANTHCVSLNSLWQNNVLCVWAYSNSRFDDKANEFRKNQTVFRGVKSFLSKDLVLTSNYHFSEAFNFDPSVTSVGNNGNFESYQFYQYSCEDATLHATAIGALDICHQRQSTTLSGVQTNTTFRNIATLSPGMLTNSPNGKYLEVFLNGNTTGSAGTKYVYLYLGGTTLTLLTIAAGTQQWFAKITIWANNSTSQVVLAEATNATVGVARSTSVTDMSQQQVLSVTGTINGAGDTSVLNEARVLAWG